MKSLSSFSLSLLAAATLANTPSAYAADTKDTKDVELPQVVVTATRTPETAGIDSSNIQIISRMEIERSGAQNVSDLLHQVAAIQLIDTIGDGTSPSIAMRGFGENGTQNSLLLLNGRRLSNDTDIAVLDLRNLSVEDIDHIEVINGSAGALFGSGAVGGVINIITKGIKPEVQVGASRGSYDQEDYRVRAGAVVDGVGVQVIGEKNLADNYRDHNELDRRYTQGRLSYDTELFGLYADASQQDISQNNPGALLQSQIDQNRRQAAHPTDFTASINQRYNESARLSFTPDWNLVLDISQRFDDTHGQLSFGNTPFAFKQSRNQQSVFPKINGVVKLGDNTIKIVAGYDRNSGDYDLLSAFGEQLDHQTIAGTYAQINWGIGHDWELVLGGRHATFLSDLKDSSAFINGIRITDSKDIGSFATYWRPVTGLTTWLRADQNFRFPMADEQTNIIFGTTTPLKTQEGWSYEGGTEYRNNSVRASLQLYQLDLQNEISTDPNNFLANINLPDTRRRGATTNLGYNFTPKLSANGQFSYVNAKFTAGPNDGKNVPMVARDNTTLNVTWLFVPGASAVLEQERLGSRYAGSDYSNSFDRLKPVNLTNLALHYKWKGLQTSLRVNNVFAKQYNGFATVNSGVASFYPAPERSLLLSVDYKLL